MSTQQLHTYCLFCVSSQEGQICNRLELMGFVALSPQVMRCQKTAGGIKKRPSRLLPGYVFFDAADLTEKDRFDILRIPSVLRFLRYGDGNYALRGTDLLFVDWLKRFNGMIEFSTVIQVGTKIRVISGPLKEMSGRIVQVNKKRKVVKISFEQENGLLQSVWCGIDYVQVDEVERDVLDAVYEKADALPVDES